VFDRYRDRDLIFWKIYGSTAIRPQINAPQKLITGWNSDVERFKSARQAYLLYY
jgi:hypothetical protein